MSILSENPMWAHALLEAWPLSSSWHMDALFNIKEQTIEYWHIHLLPSFLFVLAYFVKTRQLKNPLNLVWACIPAGLIYVLLKTPFLYPIELPDMLLHVFSASILLISLFFAADDTNYDQENLNALIFWVGIGQCLSLLFPGVSRLACSLLGLVLVRASLKDAILVSFSLQALQISVFSLTSFSQAMNSAPAFMEVLFLQVLFLTSLSMFIFLGRKAIAFCAAYRVFWIWFLM